tara:strand:+ start:336 stop:818 length:483 start_codon:yes stop_codon:yes gene_type:complete
MKNIILFLSLIFLFSCEEEQDLVEQNLLDYLKDKVVYRELDDKMQYIYFDLSYDSLSVVCYGYCGWIYYDKNNNDIEEKGCFKSGYGGGGVLQWYTEDTINTPTQFKLDRIYGQYAIVSKADDIIKIEEWAGAGATPYLISREDGFREMRKEDFDELNCN